MSFSSRDISSQQFTQARRGYDVAEVDAFLDAMGASAQRMEQQLVELANRVRVAEEKNAQYVELEASINNAFISAQASADSLKSEAQREGADLLEKARAEGERVYREAESKAREIIRQALTKRDEIAGEADRLQASESEFRERFVALLDHYYGQAHANAPATEVVAGEELVDPASDEVEDNPAEAVSEPIIEDEVAVAPEPQPVLAPEPVLEPAPVVEVAEAVVDDAAPEVALSEPAEEVVEDPFAPRSHSAQRSGSFGYDAYGEVDDELDIEEID